jgi:HlyD family secretion protein
MVKRKSLQRDIQIHVICGLLLFAILAAGLGGWATRTELAGAVIAQGLLVVETNVKKIQHPTGGVVAQINVREGDRVKENDLLISLDDTLTKANLAIVQKSLDEFDARQARLKAERDDLPSIPFPRDLVLRGLAGSGREIIGEEQRLFEIRSAARLGQKSQLKERASQLREELQGFATQIATKEREVDIVNRELEGVRYLSDKNLIPITRLMQLEREAVRISGERGVLQSSVAQTKGKITEIEIQIAQIDRDLKAETAREIREIQAKTAELVERRIAAEDQLKRTSIVSPQSGVVHQLSTHTVGGVISAAEQVMLIVPGSDELLVEARIAPYDIDQLQVGQAAVLRFSAFNQRTTPEIVGTLRTISADVTVDQKSGASFYSGRVGISREEVARLRELKLLPGMPVEVYIQTLPRTVLSYLIKPLEDQIAKAFRER